MGGHACVTRAGAHPDSAADDAGSSRAYRGGAATFLLGRHAAERRVHGRTGAAGAHWAGFGA